MSHYNILIPGASYGSLLVSKILFGGHSVKLVCLPAEADLINSDGFRVRMSVRGRKERIQIDSRKLAGKVSAWSANDVAPKDYELIGLAMQKPQYGSPSVRELLDAVAKSSRLLKKALAATQAYRIRWAIGSTAMGVFQTRSGDTRRDGLFSYVRPEC